MAETRKVIVKMMTVDTDATTMFDYFADMKNLERGGAVKSVEKEQDGWWAGETPVGRARFKHTAVSREHGILDHVFVAAGITWNAYVRVIPNKAGATVSWTFLRPDGMTDGQFEDQLRMFDLEMAQWKLDLQN